MNPAPVTPGPTRLPLRWVVLGLLVVSTFLNYFDRQILSVLKPVIKTEFGLADSHYSLLVGVFMTGYIVMYVVGGRLVDAFGSRRCMLAFVGVWSASTACTGFVGGFAGLLACRAVLGLAEPGNYPAALRATTRWFAPSERGLATSLYSAGSAVGAILAPPLIAWIAARHGWRAAFIIPGALGAVWLVAWWFFYRDPSPAPAAAASPAAPAPAAVAATPEAAPSAGRPGWRELLRRRELWGLVVARLLSDPVWYFMLFWFPGYIQERMGVTLAQAGAVAWIPFLVADVGGIAAAAFSDRLVRRGHAPVRARLAILTAAACCAPLAMSLGFLQHQLALTLVVFSVLALVCTIWLFTNAALIGDAAPRESVGTVLGISGAFGAAGGLVFNALIGPTVDAVGYTPVFVVAGGLHLAAAFVLRRTLLPRV